MTNTDNPYGDDKLLETFVWDKKLQKKGLTNVPAEHLKVMTAQRVEENKTELEKLKKQRLERERQKEEMEDEKAFPPTSQRSGILSCMGKTRRLISLQSSSSSF